MLIYAGNLIGRKGIRVETRDNVTQKNLNVTKVESGGAAPALPLSATDYRFLQLFAYLSCFKLNFNAYNDSNGLII